MPQVPVLSYTLLAPGSARHIAVREKTQRFIPSGASLQILLRNKGSQGCGGSRGLGEDTCSGFRKLE